MNNASLLLPLLVLAVLWFTMMRPQRIARQRRAQMLRQVGVGVEIVTIGGMHGTVIEADDDTVDVEISEDVIVRFDRRAIAEVRGHNEAATAEPESEPEDSNAIPTPTPLPADSSAKEA